MSVFDQFKKTRYSANAPVAILPGKAVEPYFLLRFDEAGAYIEITDKSGSPVAVAYRSYSGVVRSVLKSLEGIQQKSAFAIDWENPESRVYLHEHPYLLEPLLHSGRLLHADGREIAADERTAQLTVTIREEPEAGWLRAAILLRGPGLQAETFQFLDDTHAFLPELPAILETPPAGAQYRSIPAFNARFPMADLQKYLSLLFSYVDEVMLDYAGYTVLRSGEQIRLQPALVFEKVDADNALYMRVTQRLPQDDDGFLDEYELYRYAVINELEGIITVREVEQPELGMHIARIEKRLEKHAGKSNRKKGSGLVVEGDLFIIPDEAAAAFIYNEVPELLAEYAIAGAEKLKRYRISTTAPKLNLNLTHGIDFLEGDASLQFGNQQVSIFDAINQYNRHRYILLSNGEHALVNEAYMGKLQRLFKKKDDGARISFFDLPLVEDLIDEQTAKVQFQQSREVFEGFNKLQEEEVKLPPVQAVLRPYQVQGYKWLRYLFHQKLGGCLADDMGLGKTLQTITLLLEVYQGGEGRPSLIVMPRSLLFNWEREVRRFAPVLTTYTYYGGSRNMEEAMTANLIFTTYALMRNDIESWKEQEFCYVILDESQNIKNIQTQASRAVLLLKAEYRLALSGTPIENSLSELYSLFRFLNPSMFGSADQFNQQYLTPIQKHDDKLATHDLRRKIYPFLLRRLKKEVLTELPDKIEQKLYVEMSPEQSRYYEQRRIFYKEAIDRQVAAKGLQAAQFFIFQAMNELRQISSIPEAQTEGRITSPKVELLTEQLLDAVANGHKVLVFVNFLHAIEEIGRQLDEQGIDFVTMTGSTRNRQELVERFQEDADCKVFLLTLKTGGTGLNLTAADMVFIFDPWWNKAAETQAIDRAHRIGQRQTVLSYQLITTGTIEEKIIQLQEKKSALFQNIISDDSASLKSMSVEDIDFMLGK